MIKTELYNLKDDLQTRDVSAEHPAVVARLERLARPSYLKRRIPFPFWTIWIAEYPGGLSEGDSMQQYLNRNRM